MLVLRSFDILLPLIRRLNDDNYSEGISVMETGICVASSLFLPKIAKKRLKVCFLGLCHQSVECSYFDEMQTTRIV